MSPVTRTHVQRAQYVVGDIPGGGALPQPDDVRYCDECGWTIGLHGCGCGKDVRVRTTR